MFALMTPFASLPRRPNMNSIFEYHTGCEVTHVFSDVHLLGTLLWYGKTTGR